MNRLVIIASLLVLGCGSKQSETLEWPTITREHKPWTRWWWQGSAVTREGITRELESLKKVGIGGVEITPIYGVYGYEDQFVPYLSPQWVDLLTHTLKEAERLDMGVDMATGTGWPFGGPWVTAEDACKNMNYKTYILKEGQSLSEPLRFHQEPIVRSAGMQMYETHGMYKIQGQTNQGTKSEPARNQKSQALTIDQLVEPVEANENLQALALDQVRYDKWLSPAVVMAFSENGESIDLSAKVNQDGQLNWTAPKGTWTIYAIYPGWHGKMVERAAPGGEGNVIDHFSERALANYLHVFDTALSTETIGSLRAFFNDSYEVDDARGAADWTEDLFQEFQQRRGYDLRGYLPQLFGEDTTRMANRVLCDYRETISELIHDKFTSVWRRWANQKNKIVRNQAHGSPANILDLYAEVDIPEIEGIEPLRIKMASSAANVTGKKLTSSESATWLNEHFQSNLGDVREAIDRFFLNGVNHVFYHGTNYSPVDEPWPGWLFYAAIHMNDRNPMWTDADALNHYIARCQSVLQNSKPDNDILLYYPVYDRFSTRGPEMIEHFDGIERQFEGTAFEKAAEYLYNEGYSFDYISDKQIHQLQEDAGRLLTSGGTSYKVLLIPACEYMPVETLSKLRELAVSGVPVIFYNDYPSTFSGNGNVETKKVKWQEELGLLKKLEAGNSQVKAGNDLDELLLESTVDNEPMISLGLTCIRKRNEHGILYFVSNWSDRAVDAWVPIKGNGPEVALLNPMTSEIGRAATRRVNERTHVYLSLGVGESVLIQLSKKPFTLDSYPYAITAGQSELMSGDWKVTFEGLNLDTLHVSDLAPWHAMDSAALYAYSGTAVYSIDAPAPKLETHDLMLDLGKVGETARVAINGVYVGTTLGPEHRLRVPAGLLQPTNRVEIRVSSTMANRIADMDRRGVFWKKFYNVNFPARLAENRKDGIFDASSWAARPSGLLGPVRWVSITSIPE